MKTISHNNREKIEVEAKFICPDELGLDDLLVAISTLNLKYTKEIPCFQRDVYLDTSDYTLLSQMLHCAYARGVKPMWALISHV